MLPSTAECVGEFRRQLIEVGRKDDPTSPNARSARVDNVSVGDKARHGIARAGDHELLARLDALEE